MRAIETTYNGYRFRSRLEARWAVFFDRLSIPYRYELEGYELWGGICYLPDFWLPEQECWIEIKGDVPTEDEESKMRELVSFTDKRGFIFYGDIPYPCPSPADDDSALALYPEGADYAYWWCRCSDCGKYDIRYMGHSDRMPCKAKGCSRSKHGDKGYSYDAFELVSAYAAARSARFSRVEAFRAHG